jgi:radical SAM superfamily enzyme YgiQ (UPF0313 family)
VRRSIVVDSKCDILLYGNAERALVEVAHRIAAREPVEQITDVRGTAFFRRASEAGWFEVDSTTVDEPGEVEPHINPYMTTSEQAEAQGQSCSKEDGEMPERTAPAKRAGIGSQRPAHPVRAQSALRSKSKLPPRERTVLRLPSYEAGQERPDSLRPRQPRAAPGDQPRQRPRAGAGPWRGPRRAMCG